MKTRVLLALLPLLIASSLPAVPVTPGSGAAKPHGHPSTATVPIPATAAGIWTEINTHHRKLGEMITAKQLKEADTHIDALDALLKALPGKSTDLPEAKQKTVAGMVKNADTALDALHEAAEAGKQDVAAAKFKQFDSVLKILRAQYPAETTAGGAAKG